MRCTASNNLHRGTKEAGLEIAALWDKQGGKCALTGRPLVIGGGAGLDHKTPISKGGSREIENVRWVCFAANAAKNVMSDAELFTLCEDILRHAGLMSMPAPRKSRRAAQPSLALAL